MAKYIYFLVIVALSIQTAFSQDLTMVYRFDQPIISRSGDFEVVYFEGCRLFGEEGKATLPFFPVKLLLPPGEIAQSITIIYEDEKIVHGSHVLLPRQMTRPLSDERPQTWQMDSVFYASAQRYPAEKDAKVSSQFFRGYGISLAAFCPLRFVPSSGQVSYYGKVTVTIKTIPDPDAAKHSLYFHFNRENINTIKAIVQNPGNIAGYPANRAMRTNDYDYLVVTGNDYLAEFDTLSSFYKYRGIKTQVVSVQHIDTVESGQDLAEKIRNYIIGEYEDHNIRYVLIGGDVGIVPYRGLYCSVLSGGSYMTDSNIPSDLYFSALDGSWNDDGDNLWGEPGEEDLYPEVAVGRLTFSDTTELHNMLHKTFSYQEQPVTGELTHPLLAGEFLYSNPITWGADYMRLLRGLRTDNGYTTSGIPLSQPADSLFDLHSTWSKNDLINEINTGKPWVHHCGHANYGYTMKLYNSDITNANFSQANGIDHNYTIVYTHGCDCGAFDQSDCIAEKMVGIDNFAVAFVGNSRYGWFVEGTSDGPSEHLHREFLDALYRDSLYRAGDALMRSKSETAPFVDLQGEYEPGATRWCFYDNYLLGDPLMAMWTEEPHEITADYFPLVPAGADSIVVHLSCDSGSCKGFTCSLFMNDTLFGRAVSDSTGKAMIMAEDYLNIGQASIVVTGYNILPHSYALEIADYWLGYTGDWNDPGNWYSGIVPGPNSCVFIPADPVGSKFPVTNSGSTRQCKTIFLDNGVEFKVLRGETFSVIGY